MMKHHNYKLNNQLLFSVEHSGRRIRLIISDQQEELACRKENLAALIKFLDLTHNHIFKGRLQLAKKEEQISLILKNTEVGVISVPRFRSMLFD